MCVERVANALHVLIKLFYILIWVQLISQTLPNIDVDSAQPSINKIRRNETECENVNEAPELDMCEKTSSSTNSSIVHDGATTITKAASAGETNFCHSSTKCSQRAII